jgi:hypothetical protein
VQPPLLTQQPNLEHPKAEQTEEDDQQAAHPLQPHLVVIQSAAQRGCAGTEQHEHEREPHHEEQRVEEGCPPTPAYLGQCHPRDESDIRGHEWQDARREKAQQTGSERNDEAQGRGLVHNGPSSRWRHSRHTP